MEMEAALPSWAPVRSQGEGDSKSPTLSVMSYNILLPNSVDGWWNYKMYDPRQPREEVDRICSWEYRKSLLQRQVAAVDPEVLCIQEASERSYETDFEWLKEAGYDMAVHPKGRFRPATFWKSSALELLCAPKSKDRFVLTVFKVLSPEDTNEKCRVVAVVNNHLQAGMDLARRLRQIHTAVDTMRKDLHRLLEKDSSFSSDKVSLVCCGDFNEGTPSAVETFLLSGLYYGELSSKKKTHPFSFKDAYAGRESPTMLCAPLIPVFLDGDNLSPLLLDALKRIYQRRVPPSKGVWGQPEVDDFLLAINRSKDRGSESKAAAEFMEEAEGELSEDKFIEIYKREIDHGKYWGVFHDLYALGEAVPLHGRFETRMDYVYVANVEVCAALVCPIAEDEFLPSRRHPSDHVPVGAKFVLA